MISLAFGIYILLSAVILGMLYRQSPREWLLRMVVVTVFPVIGWLFPLFWPRRLFKDAGGKLDDYIAAQQKEMSVQHLGIYSKLETEKELNVLSIEEALLVSEHSTRRKVMIDVLKQDAINYLEILQTAVSNEDTETSHYAVSAIMEVKRKLTLSLQELSVQYENNKEDVHVLSAYADVLKGYLRSGFLDDRTLRKYKFIYLGVLERYTGIAENACEAFVDKVDLELELKRYAEAEETCRVFEQRYSHIEEVYLCYLKVYFTIKSAEKLQHTFSKLKKSPLKLSNHALTLVRFWSEGA
ncbi:hypothetical protein [Paenibacillus spongiae]|uniref:Uncharacterized protein n=1 Tax=Paenibacillus spongiae TaxID=2909671 RepID=A0ABY5SBE4_9BACL|nr:hypothetical protein [Paenibacillus spongiae]UVI31256.1 hypothetical protein L1F29_05275 [Paenibacillus spongiae]